MTIKTCSLVGTGVAAAAVGPALVGAGIHIVSIAGRDVNKVAHLAGELGAKPRTLAESVNPADLVLLCVADSAIPSVAEKITAGFEAGRCIVAHMSGASVLEVLEPARARSVRVGKMHPIASLAGGSDRLYRIVWGIEGSEDVAADLRELIEALDGTPLDLSQTSLEQYHLAAVFASNFVLAVIGVAEDLWHASGAPMPAREALVPLVRSAIANWEELGVKNALTGPIARGDAAAVAAQLRAMTESGTQAERLYRALGVATAEIAAEKMDVDPSVIAEIVRILDKDSLIN